MLVARHEVQRLLAGEDAQHGLVVEGVLVAPAGEDHQRVDVAQAARVVDEMPYRDRPAVVRQLRHVLPHVVIRAELPLPDGEGRGHGGELLRHRARVEDRVGRDRRVVLEVGHPVAAGVHGAAVLVDAERAAGRVGPVPLREDRVDLRRPGRAPAARRPGPGRGPRGPRRARRRPQPQARRVRHVTMRPSRLRRRFASRYFAGIGLSGRSWSHITVTIHQRPPCCINWIELMPRAKGFSSALARLDSYVLNTCMMRAERLLPLARPPLEEALHQRVVGPRHVVVRRQRDRRRTVGPRGRRQRAARRANRPRKRSQSRACPAGPEITS